MVEAETPGAKLLGSFLVRDKDGRPKFDKPIREYPEWAQEAFRKAMTPAEVEEFFA